MSLKTLFCFRLSVKGFTLLELLVVLLIMSISMGLFLGFNYSQRESIQLKATAKELSQFLRTAKSYSLVEGKKNKCLYLPNKNIVIEELHQRRISVPPSISIAHAGQEGKEQVLLATFFPDGSAVAESIQLQSSEEKIKVQIDPLLGDITISESE